MTSKARALVFDSAVFWSTLVSLRRAIHADPEPGFSEFKTRKKIRDLLELHGVIVKGETFVKEMAVSGMVVDIEGTAPPVEPSGNIKTIALRADLDALTMTEQNRSLPHRSQNEGLAHMCGHDGHMTALCGAALILASKRELIPKGCKVRLLFQPAEEGTPAGTAGYDFDKTGGGGSVPMMWGGALDG
eukprot:7168433-Prymnesium_polylepis.1